ncbi:MAG: nitroreductase family protein, partial [Rectinemataceae bacterium]|nr:nitroreductase family protein [Rectinemataceae bacterium]
IHWARAQTYLASAMMMTGAASIGIDSCPIEGFDETKVLEAVGADSNEWTVGIVVAFGWRDEEIRPKIREKPEALSEIL